MLFNSYAFLFLFLPIILGFSLRLRGQWLLGWITLASFTFYAFQGQPWILAVLLWTIVSQFILGIRIEDAPSAASKRRWFLVSLGASLALLGFFKYGDGLMHGLSRHSAGFLLVPVGLSFYTFQMISYATDVYLDDTSAEHNFWKFAAYVSFFPRLLAGPLVRKEQLIPPLGDIAERGVEPRWTGAIFLFAAGLCKKTLIGDRIGESIDVLLMTPHSLNAATAWMAILGYAVQIYFDFSGYSDMAIGTARLFGIELPQNFNSPFKAVNASDFWRRWHMSLTLFLTHYLFNPIAMAMARARAQRGLGLRGNSWGNTLWISAFPAITTMSIVGIWHGTGWTFFIFGFLHGLYLAVNYVWHRLKKNLPGLMRVPAWMRLAGARALMFMAACLAWVFFRSGDLPMAWDWLRALCGGGTTATLTGLWGLHGYRLTLIAGGLLIGGIGPNSNEIDSFEKTGRVPQIALGALTVLALLYMNRSSAFLYMQF